jgi:type II restriction enzyme
VAEKHRLRLNRAGTVLNLTSKQQESEVGQALEQATLAVLNEFGLLLRHRKRLPLKEVADALKRNFPDVEFYEPTPRTSMNPDGGILSIEDKDGELYPILISEVKNQGTNDLRQLEGKRKQARGNAIERLGKNVIGLRTAMLHEGIVPFVCFGYGIDFEAGSTILDRVATIAMFGELNTTNVVNLGEGGLFNRGSFYFRQEPWTVPEMTEIMSDIASRSVHYYIAKYGKAHFKTAVG